MLHEGVRPSGLVIPRQLATITFIPIIHDSYRQPKGFIAPTYSQVASVTHDSEENLDQSQMEVIEEHTFTDDTLADFALRSIESLCKIRNSYGNRKIDGGFTIDENASEQEQTKLMEIARAIAHSEKPGTNPTGMYL